MADIQCLHNERIEATERKIMHIPVPFDIIYTTGNIQQKIFTIQNPVRFNKHIINIFIGAFLPGKTESIYFTYLLRTLVCIRSNLSLFRW